MKLTHWTPDMDEQLVAIWNRFSTRVISEQMQLPPHVIRRRARRLKLMMPNRARLFEPQKQEWVEVATAEAAQAKLNRVKLLAGERKKVYSEARWRAWQAIMASNPRLSIAGVARISGFHHTSVMNGLRRLQAMEVAA